MSSSGTATTDLRLPGDGAPAQASDVVPGRLHRLVPKYLAALGCNGIALSLSLLTTLALTRFLGPGRYGEWSIFLSNVAGWLSIGTHWTAVGLTRYAAEEHAR